MTAPASLATQVTLQLRPQVAMPARLATVLDGVDSLATDLANSRRLKPVMAYPTFDDPDASALTYFGGLGMPTTVFIDAAGNVVDVHTGPLTEAELQAKITDLFGIAA